MAILQVIFRVLLAFLASVIVTFVFASVFHTQNVLASLQELGVEISPSTRLSTTFRDMVGLASLYALMISIALLIGFIIAFVLKRLLTPLAPIAYPLAGAVAIGTMLWLMNIQFNATPIAGARGFIGFSLQMLAGALGGLVFALLPRQRA